MITDYLLWALLFLIGWPMLILGALYIYGLLLLRKIKAENKANKSPLFVRQLSAYFVGELTGELQSKSEVEAEWILRNIASCKTVVQLDCCRKMMEIFNSAYPGEQAAIDRMLDSYNAIRGVVELTV